MIFIVAAAIGISVPVVRILFRYERALYDIRFSRTDSAEELREIAYDALHFTSRRSRPAPRSGNPEVRDAE